MISNSSGAPVLQLGTSQGTTEPSTKSVWSVQHHAEACRAVTFLDGGAKLLSCSLDKSVALMDAEVDGAVCWQQQNAYAAGINACHLLPHALLGLIATGDDDGAVKLWDVRQRQVRLKVSRAMRALFVRSVVFFMYDSNRRLQVLLPMTTTSVISHMVMMRASGNLSRLLGMVL
eukprot:SAG31_NODE_6126_length_2158_cov_0.930549_3_plen_174_part_00